MEGIYPPTYFCCMGDYGAVLKRGACGKPVLLLLYPLAGESRMGDEVPELVGLARKTPRDSARAPQDLPG